MLTTEQIEKLTPWAAKGIKRPKQSEIQDVLGVAQEVAQLEANMGETEVTLVTRLNKQFYTYTQDKDMSRSYLIEPATVSKKGGGYEERYFLQWTTRPEQATNLYHQLAELGLRTGCDPEAILMTQSEFETLLASTQEKAAQRKTTKDSTKASTKATISASVITARDMLDVDEFEQQAETVGELPDLDPELDVDDSEWVMNQESEEIREELIAEGLMDNDPEFDNF